MSPPPSRPHTTNHHHATDQNDESLRKWKESLGLGTGKDISDKNDPRKCIILSLGLEVDGRPDIVIDLKDPGAVDSLKDKPFTIKEGAQFRMKAVFKVQHELLAGLKYVQVVKRMGVSHKMQEMMGSFGPNTEEKPVHEKKCTSGDHPLALSIADSPCSRARDSTLRYGRPRPLQGHLQIC